MGDLEVPPAHVPTRRDDLPELVDDRNLGLGSPETPLEQ